jgi:hypothetical protein
VTLVALLLNAALSAAPLSGALFWLLIACVGLLVFSGLLLWQYRRAALRLLRDTSPPA